MWQRYYDVKQIVFPPDREYLRNHGKWAIFFNEDSANAGKVAYQCYYRTKAHAEKGAERLYKREHGAMEAALLGVENNF